MRKLFFYFLCFLVPAFKFFERKKLRVLAYHNVKDQRVFEEQIKYLASNYNIINIQKLMDHLTNGEPLPDYSLLITFDDGDISVYEKGIKILENHKLPSCLFIISGLINTNNNYWADTVRINERQKGKSETEIRDIVKKLKDLPNKKRLDIIETYPPTLKTQLSVSQIEELIMRGMFIGNHSYSHPMFNRCTKEELKTELNLTHKLFKQWKINGYSVFAYPNGNYDVLSEEVLKECNIKMAFLFDHKINSRQLNSFRISRIRVDSDTPMAEYKVKVSGFHSILYQLRN